MVFQQFNLFPHLTALDNIARPLRSAKKISREESELAAARGLQQVGLLDWARTTPPSSPAVRRRGSRSPVRSASTRR